MRRNQRENAFTLIEVLIVIIVLGILVAVVLLALGTFRNVSVAAACRTDVKAIRTAAEAVRAKTGSYPADESAFVPSTLQEWPGGTVTTHPGNGHGNGHGNGATTTSDDLAFTFAGTSSIYTLGVYGKALPGAVLTESSSADEVAAACTGP